MDTDKDTDKDTDNDTDKETYIDRETDKDKDMDIELEYTFARFPYAAIVAAAQYGLPVTHNGASFNSAINL